MAVPARRTSKMRKNTRRSHHALISRTTSNCPNCGSVVLPHHACMKCHTYKGENIPTSKKTTALAQETEAKSVATPVADNKDKDKTEIKK
ncbi:50S ribosomal protein L32 [Spiroplasma platyhelix PALS-1]|uniref:Large ribosomal subunit protein bL32 n=1 Tax=Spiroplasma platyhelix PALS-1 TaxID=1276218 RepID=A0A846UE81_9MOLU|nr:50S ribosomal protein L32 [Spiroplasma platyhelix]MBE4704416.1 50S ribosomal protein L32 [Spiroplasma platyhelix PALS-1]NKE38788.1 50S ribosomal protein L32 [Spiroplasma platyhelix PALS-1]UJB28999.1 50S ribosomal protein L32 [Spiroplasma platyhelix PALS-1]